MNSKPGRSVSRPMSKSSETTKPLSTPDLAEIFPSLHQFLQNERDFGEIHKTGCVTLFSDGASFKVCLNDRPARQSAFTAHQTLWGALCRADRGLEEGSLQWSAAHYRRRAKRVVNKTTG